ncbi:MAG TPA: hypothetical protein PKN27_05875 [Propionibacteriaceae bacterium]|nr:hypothetical protein [Propionibacteriaceae bacterium]
MPNLDQSVALVVDALDRGARWIVVDGLGASGKTTFASGIVEARPQVQVVHLDDFTRPGSVAWESERFLEQVYRPLAGGSPASYQRWHWTQAEPGEWVDLGAGRPVVLEGIWASDPAVAVDWDLRVWLEVPEEERCARALLRDPARYECWSTTWRPIEAKWAATQRPWERADVVVTA